MTCRMKRADVIDNANIQAGDVVVGLASAGQATYETEYQASERERWSERERERERDGHLRGGVPGECVREGGACVGGGRIQDRIPGECVG